MLTGERPFKGSTAVDMISSILRDQPPPIHDVRPDLPPHLGRILRRCLEKEPRDRYQTSRDVYNELKDLRVETSSPSASLASSPKVDAGAPIPRRPRGVWIAVIAAVLLALML